MNKKLFLFKQVNVCWDIFVQLGYCEIKGTVMQIEKTLINDLENFAFQLILILQQFTREICYFLKNQPTFQQFLLSFLFINKTVRLKNLKARTAINAKISLFVICVEAIIYSLLYNLHCTVPLKLEKNLWNYLVYNCNFVV